MSSKIPDVHPCLRFYAGVAQLVEQRIRFPATEMNSSCFWLLTRGSQVRILSPVLG